MAYVYINLILVYVIIIKLLQNVFKSFFWKSDEVSHPVMITNLKPDGSLQNTPVPRRAHKLFGRK